MGARRGDFLPKTLILAFQSTRPHGGATNLREDLAYYCGISIHAPAWGRDSASQRWKLHSKYFNPRARMGARHLAITEFISILEFQSTRPHGGATSYVRLGEREAEISIHAPAWGRD